MSQGAEAAETRRDSRATRVAVTLGACAAVLVLERITLPFIDAETLAAYFRFGGTQEVSPFSLGLVPFITGFVVVEFLALAVPRWRPLRVDAGGRATLTRAAWALSLALAAIQGWGVGRYLQSVRDVRGEALLPEGLGATLIVATTIVAGTAAAGWLATRITERGMGNGFAILFALLELEDLAYSGLRALLSSGNPAPWSDAGVISVLAIAVVGPLVYAHAARRRDPAAPRVPLLTCSVSALQLPFGLLELMWLVVGLLALDPERVRRGWTMGPAFPYLWVALVVVTALPLSRVFFPREAVLAAWGRAGVDASAAGGALTLAHRWSLALVGLGAALPILAAELGIGTIPSRFGLIAAITLVAVLADLRGEWRARAGGRALVPIRALHRVYEAGPVLRALASAGIDGHARSGHFRALFHVFAPYAPIEILVPEQRAAEAGAICGRVAAGT